MKEKIKMYLTTRLSGTVLVIETISTCLLLTVQKQVVSALVSWTVVHPLLFGNKLV